MVPVEPSLGAVPLPISPRIIRAWNYFAGIGTNSLRLKSTSAITRLFVCLSCLETLSNGADEGGLSKCVSSIGGTPFHFAPDPSFAGIESNRNSRKNFAFTSTSSSHRSLPQVNQQMRLSVSRCAPWMESNVKKKGAGTCVACLISKLLFTTSTKDFEPSGGSR